MTEQGELHYGVLPFSVSLHFGLVRCSDICLLAWTISFSVASKI